MITAGWFMVMLVVGMVLSLGIGWSIGYSHGRYVGIAIGRHRSRKP
jgi:hypothetical protein